VNLVVKFPTRNRPQKFIEVFLKYQHMVSGKHTIRFVVSMDGDDPTMNNDRIRTFLSKQGNVSFFYGDSQSKIEAVNADLEHLGQFDVLLLASDDMIPVEPGYDDIIANGFVEHFPDYDGVLHFDDGRRGEQLNTLCVMGKKYFDRFGYIYHPAYTSVFCDNEFTDVSRNLGKAKYIPREIIRHGWVQYVGFDALAARNENPEYYAKDGAVYAQRKEQGFPK
jgi:hypothetical protein